MHRLRTTLVAAAFTVALAGCGLIVGGDSDPDSQLQPTMGADPSMTLESAPAEFAEVSGTGFTLSAPAEFLRSDLTSQNGQPMLVLERPSLDQAIPQRVAVVLDVDPASSAAEQSKALEVAKSVGNPDGPVVRVELATDTRGASAYLMTWEEQLTTPDGQFVPVTYWQLMYQVDESLIVNVVAFAPSEEFEDSAVSTILRSFQPT